MPTARQILFDVGVFGSILGGAIKPVTEGVRDVAVEHQKTQQLTEIAQAWARVASASWRPWLARAIGWLLILYVLGTFAMIAATMLGIMRGLLWVGDMTLADLWENLISLGSDLFWFSGLFLTTYTGSRGLEKISGSIRGKTGRLLGSAARVVTGGSEPEQREIIREELDVNLGEGIERIDGVHAPQTAVRVAQSVRPLDTNQLASEIRADEGVRYHTYRDTEGYLTMGIGHKVLPTDPEYNQPDGSKVTRERVARLFSKDLSIALAAARRVVPDFDQLPHDARLVLVNMAFQLGEAGLSKFRRMLEAIGDRDWQAAADEALDSKWATQTPKRARRMASRLRALSGLIVT